MRWIFALFTKKIPPTQAELSRRALENRPPSGFSHNIKYKMRKGRISSGRSG